MRRATVRRLAFALVLLASAAAAEDAKSAAPGGFGDFSFTSRKDPIQVTSEKLDFDYKSRRTVFRGKVQVVQADVHLTCDTFTVDYEQQGEQQTLKAVNADGNVTILQGARKATGDHAVFDQSTRTLVLTGRPALEDGLNQVKGDKIIVYPDESRMEVSGDNSRVKVILFPGQGAPGKEPTPRGAEPTKTPETRKVAETPAPKPASAGAEGGAGDGTP